MAALSHGIPELDRRGLRSFGLTAGLIVAVVFGVLFPWLLGRATPWWPWVIAAVLGGWAWVAPISLRHLYRVWMRFGLLMGRITTPLILGLTYFLLITPLGFGRGLLGRDAMERRFDRSALSYRRACRKRPATHMEKPY